jgi:hypothetical protein
MSTDLLPAGETLRKAVRWISEQRRDDPGANIKKLVEEAGLRFDLPPLDQEYLWHTFVQAPASG